MEGRTGIMSDEEFRELSIADFYKERAKTFNNSPTDGMLMTTRAGTTTYDRTFMESFIRPGMGRENWVNRGNYPLRGVVQTGPAEMSMYVMRHYMQDSWHIERLTLRLDGFASLHAPYQGGEMLTKLLTFDGGKLTLNYATSAAGGIAVEIQDAEGKPIPGYGAADCDPVVGDEITRTVTWRGNSDVNSLKNRTIRLRLALRDADVFSLKFE
jgi:hypothetical protein